MLQELRRSIIRSIRASFDEAGLDGVYDEASERETLLAMHMSVCAHPFRRGLRSSQRVLAPAGLNKQTNKRTNSAPMRRGLGARLRYATPRARQRACALSAWRVQVVAAAAAPSGHRRIRRSSLHVRPVMPNLQPLRALARRMPCGAAACLPTGHSGSDGVSGNGA